MMLQRKVTETLTNVDLKLNTPVGSKIHPNLKASFYKIWIIVGTTFCYTKSGESEISVQF
jgi:hypothetical protein